MKNITVEDVKKLAEAIDSLEGLQHHMKSEILGVIERVLQIKFPLNPLRSVKGGDFIIRQHLGESYTAVVIETESTPVSRYIAVSEKDVSKRWRDALPYDEFIKTHMDDGFTLKSK